VFLNAFPLDRTQWDACVEQLLAAAGDLIGDVITFDMPGMGAMPLADGEPSLDLVAVGAVAAMREVTGADAALWVGCSMGGYVAMAIAERFPDAIAGLALIATRSGADTDEGRAKRLAVAAANEALAHPADPSALAEPLVGTQGPARADVLDAVTENIARQSGAAIAWAQRAMAARPERTAAVQALDVPGIVIAGELDGVIAAAETQTLAASLRAPLIVVPGVGHLVAMEAPDAVANSVAGLFAARGD